MYRGSEQRKPRIDRGSRGSPPHLLLTPFCSFDSPLISNRPRTVSFFSRPLTLFFSSTNERFLSWAHTWRARGNKREPGTDLVSLRFPLLLLCFTGQQGSNDSSIELYAYIQIASRHGILFFIASDSMNVKRENEKYLDIKAGDNLKQIKGNSNNQIVQIPSGEILFRYVVFVGNYFLGA